MDRFQTHFVSDSDKSKWRAFFNGYAAFYEVSMDDATADQVWQWLLDPNHVLEGLLTRNSGDEAIGLAHVRACPHSLGGSEVGFLDDLFVVPEARGGGGADAMFKALKKLASDREWPSIRWITQHFNERGRSFYDR